MHPSARSRSNERHSLEAVLRSAVQLIGVEEQEGRNENGNQSEGTSTN